ncbi:MAG: dockerin type I domain-containing protein, partial [Ignavibacteria bacterium]
FTTAAAKAFGDNMKQVDLSPIRFGIYSGDVNQDGVIDGSDAALIDNDAANFATGYRVTDLNGDQVIDGSDASIVDNNAANFVSKITP